VHPTDLAEARRRYRRAWAISLVGSAQCLFLLGAFVWAVSDNVVAPALAVVSTGVVAEAVRRFELREAWAYIPRRRQDAARPDPLRWCAVRAGVQSASLIGGLVLILGALAERGYGGDVCAYSLGTAAAIAVVMVGTAGWNWRGTRTRSARFELVADSVSVVVGAALLWVLGWIPVSPALPAVLTGAVVLIGVYAVWAWAAHRSRRA
jgi:O-antigen/teichoic acid export membrane protein